MMGVDRYRLLTAEELANGRRAAGELRGDRVTGTLPGDRREMLARCPDLESALLALIPQLVAERGGHWRDSPARMYDIWTQELPPQLSATFPLQRAGPLITRIRGQLTRDGVYFYRTRAHDWNRNKIWDFRGPTGNQGAAATSEAA